MKHFTLNIEKIKQTLDDLKNLSTPEECLIDLIEYEYLKELGDNIPQLRKIIIEKHDFFDSFKITWNN